MNRQTPVLTSDEFGKFFSEYKNRFVSIAYGYVHDTDIAKDIVRTVSCIFGNIGSR